MMNASNVTTDEDYFVEDSLAVTIIKQLAYAIVFIVALVGNSLVIASVFQSKRMRTITNYLIVNMAVVDMFFTLIVIPQTYLGLAKYQWEKSIVFEFCCKGFNFSHYMLQGVSVLTLAVIAADRYFAIMIPFKKILTKKVFYIALLMIWITGVAVASPILYAYRVVEEKGRAYCQEIWEPLFDSVEASKFYTVLLFIVVYCIPFLVMAFIYSIICNKLWRRKLVGELNQSGKKILASRKKVVKMLVSVLIAFMVCWLPVQIVSLWGYFNGVAIIPAWLHFICFFVMHAHPAINPCIYIIFSENFRYGFKMAIRCLCLRGRSQILEYQQTVCDRGRTVLLRYEKNQREGEQSRATAC